MFYLIKCAKLQPLHSSEEHEVKPNASDNYSSLQKLPPLRPHYFNYQITYFSRSSLKNQLQKHIFMTLDETPLSYFNSYLLIKEPLFHFHLVLFLPPELKMIENRHPPLFFFECMFMTKTCIMISYCLPSRH